MRVWAEFYTRTGAGMGFLVGIYLIRGHGYEIIVPIGYVPVAISTCLSLIGHSCTAPRAVD
jgi:hypothetical protein